LWGDPDQDHGPSNRRRGRCDGRGNGSVLIGRGGGRHHKRLGQIAKRLFAARAQPPCDLLVKCLGLVLAMHLDTVLSHCDRDVAYGFLPMCVDEIQCYTPSDQAITGQIDFS